MSGDKPIEQIALMAEGQVFEQGNTIFQKWTCSYCSSRQTMDEPNVLYRSGICQECGKTSDITHCGFLMVTGDKDAPAAQAILRSIRDSEPQR